MWHHGGEAGAHQPSLHPAQLLGVRLCLSAVDNVVDQIRPDHALSWGGRVNRVGDPSWGVTRATGRGQIVSSLSAEVIREG